MEKENLNKLKNLLFASLSDNNGILRLKPSWVARDFLFSGRRLGLKEEDYDLGEKGEISERWVGSTTKADTNFREDNDGLSYICLGKDVDDTDNNFLLRELVACAPGLLMGDKYSKTHCGLGKLTKVFCFGDRLFYHLHQRKQDVEKLGKNSKDEAYYFPDNVDLGSHPETFFGVHPYIAEQKKYDILLSYLVDWDSDLILKHSRGYLQTKDDGFFLPAGIPHAPGTAVTIELQEDSDVFANLQALLAGKIVSKETLYKDISLEDRQKYGERKVLDQIDWQASSDPYFYENHHTPPLLIKESIQPGGQEYWIFYNTKKFSGKKLVVKPRSSYISNDMGVYNLLVWEGSGTFDNHFIEAFNFNYDELFVTHERAIKPIEIRNTGSKNLQIFKFFGPDINDNVAMIPKYEFNNS